MRLSITLAFTANASALIAFVAWSADAHRLEVVAISITLNCAIAAILIRLKETFL